MAIDPAIMRWAAATFLNRDILEAEALKTGVLLGNFQELLPWILYKQLNCPDLYDLERAIKISARQLSQASPMGMDANAWDLVHNRNVEDSLHGLIMENIEHQEKAHAADRAIANQVRNSAADHDGYLAYRAVLPD